jgi:hypothetical protein
MAMKNYGGVCIHRQLIQILVTLMIENAYNFSAAVQNSCAKVTLS